jgi:hypothetical protein
MHADTMAAREKLYTIRFTDEENARLEALARHFSLPASGVIRMLLKREADALGLTLQVSDTGSRRTPKRRR